MLQLHQQQPRAFLPHSTQKSQESSRQQGDISCRDASQLQEDANAAQERRQLPPIASLASPLAGPQQGPQQLSLPSLQQKASVNEELFRATQGQQLSQNLGNLRSGQLQPPEMDDEAALRASIANLQRQLNRQNGVSPQRQSASLAPSQETASFPDVQDMIAMLLREHREASARYAEATAAAAQAAATQNAILESLAALQAKEILQAAFQFQGHDQMPSGNDPISMLNRLTESSTNPTVAQVADTSSLPIDRLSINELEILSRLLSGSMSSSGHVGSTIAPPGFNIPLPISHAARALGTPSANTAANANESLPSDIYRILGSQPPGNISMEPSGTHALSSQSADDVTSLLLTLLQAPESSRPLRNQQLPQQQPLLQQELLQLLAAASTAPAAQSSGTATRATPGAFLPPDADGQFQSPSAGDKPK
jgi:hypothetical protein